MTEAQVRQKVVGVMQKWVGIKEGTKAHKKIVDTFNEYKDKPTTYVMQYDDPWCATTVSAAEIEAGLADIFPLECSCGRMIEEAIKMKCWQEDDAYIPSIGDCVLYDWDDKTNYATTENNGWPEHVGMVEKIVGNVITIIEGNKSDSVSRRNLKVNGRYIRGYIAPNYASKADAKIEDAVTKELKVGDIVNFTGNKQYRSSYTGAKESAAKSCKARITAMSKGKAHPYHLIAVSGSGVYGWVDAKDIDGSNDVEIKVGDTVTYKGNVHYTSSYNGATSKKCKGGTAKVTAIQKGRPHPYHLVGTGVCTVYGWVDHDKVVK